MHNAFISELASLAAAFASRVARLVLFLVAISVCGLASDPVAPRSKFYPFGQRSLSTVREIASAEGLLGRREIDRAWSFFARIAQNPGGLSRENRAEVLADLDEFKATLLSAGFPDWLA